MATASAAATAPAPASRARFQPKHLFFLVYGVLALIAIYHQDLPLLNANSPARQHLAPVTRFIIPHGVFGALALALGAFQYSTRLRQRYLSLHRWMGRVYVGSVFVAAPAAIPVAIILGPPELVMAAIIQSTGWLVTTALAVYFVRTGNIHQHRQWMIRSYPFAMVFVVVRAILTIPVIERLGLVGVVSVVWSCIAAACFVPTFVINWRTMFPAKAAARAVTRVQAA
jgi:uncharacterized membrane protein